MPKLTNPQTYKVMKGRRRNLRKLLRSFAVGDECWEWQGTTTIGGYGKFGMTPSLLAHRAIYEVLVGPIPDGLTLDHLCRNRKCVRPNHLEPVTQRENTLRSPIAPAAVNARQRRCIRGHEFSPENTYIRKNGARTCRTCMRQHWAAFRKRKKEKVAA